MDLQHLISDSATSLKGPPVIISCALTMSPVTLNSEQITSCSSLSDVLCLSNVSLFGSPFSFRLDISPWKMVYSVCVRAYRFIWQDICLDVQYRCWQDMKYWAFGISLSFSLSDVSMNFSTSNGVPFCFRVRRCVNQKQKKFKKNRCTPFRWFNFISSSSAIHWKMI